MEERILNILPHLNEKQKRLFLGNEAKAYGHGGVKKVHEITGVSKTTIIRGKKEIEVADPNDVRIRKIGGGRKTVRENRPEIVREIESIVGESTFGNPENPLSYTTKSTRKIQDALNGLGYEIGSVTVGKLLKESGYSLRLNQKMLQVGEEHPDRDAQFRFTNEKSLEFLRKKEPVISVDAKKKELVGNFKNNGRTYNRKKSPAKVFGHDFPLEVLGKATPYGIYDISQNEGFVNLGISKDTAEFAVESISRWWLGIGRNTYPGTGRIYITCDGGGSNSSRGRLFRSELQEFANQSGLEVHVSHFPPGTSKWNKIEHRLFCCISSNWKGQPLINIETIISLIGSTEATSGLKVVCVKDDNTYEIGKKISNADFEKINIKREKTCPNWNYTISPNL